jgi:hypothetical protein
MLLLLLLLSAVAAASMVLSVVGPPLRAALLSPDSGEAGLGPPGLLERLQCDTTPNDASGTVLAADYMMYVVVLDPVVMHTDLLVLLMLLPTAHSRHEWFGRCCLLIMNLSMAEAILRSAYLAVRGRAAR